MYCVKCGVRLSDTEEKCPLCHTGIGEIIERESALPLYPKDRIPERKVNKGTLNGTMLFLWMIPLLVTFFVDLQADGKMQWWPYVAGAMVLGYVMFLLPVWFHKPNPVIFVPCSFAAVALYLLLIVWLTEGSWYWNFALPVICGIALPVTALVTLLRYIKKGRLFILGGAFIVLGAIMLLVEGLMVQAFHRAFTGWSVYPLIAMVLLGGLLVFLGINKTARERMERRFFF